MNRACQFLNFLIIRICWKNQTNWDFTCFISQCILSYVLVALLLCYQPKIDKSRGKQGKRHLLSQEQLFLNMLRIILNEVGNIMWTINRQVVFLPGDNNISSESYINCIINRKTKWLGCSVKLVKEREMKGSGKITSYVLWFLMRSAWFFYASQYISGDKISALLNCTHGLSDNQYHCIML